MYTHTPNLSKSPKKVLGISTASEFILRIDGARTQVANPMLGLEAGGEEVRQGYNLLSASRAQNLPGDSLITHCNIFCTIPEVC